jgi:hypothetical protein
MVSFSSPEEEVDRISRLHVLWQTGAQSFSYVIVGADGSVVARDTYDTFDSRPHLTVNDNGDVLVLGGVRRPKPGEMPLVPETDTPSNPPVKPQP